MPFPHAFGGRGVGRVAGVWNDARVVFPCHLLPALHGADAWRGPCDRCRPTLFGRGPVPVPATLPAPATSAFPPGPSPENLAGAVQPGAYSSSAFLDPYGRPLIDPGVRLAAPVPDMQDSGRNASPSLGAPMPQPPVVDDRDASSPPPVDIPQFAIVKDRIASGLQPFPDGITWLQTHHYRTVLHIRAPGEDDAAARRQFEKHGLRYLSLEAAPNTLSRAVVDEFDRIVTDESDRPLFVYGTNGAVVGGLWYLYFRTAEKASDETAQSQAARLGLRPDEGGEQRTMWIAIQNYLRNLN